MDDRAVSIPGWKIIRTIGKGSFGTVYEVEKEDGFGGGIRSALKVISIPESGSEVETYRDDGYDDASLTALYRSRVEEITAEFRLMNKLKGCNNIVSYEDHAIVQHENDPGYDIFIRMELLTALPKFYDRNSGGNLIHENIVRKLGADICRALERCGRHNIIHRDIKPQNIFVNEEGDFKLGDFGIAKTSDHTTKATKTGTYGYMAPEVYLSKPYNASVDIYSLGLVLYWMLNERRGPFVPLPPEIPKSSQNAEALDRRMHGEPLPAPKHGSEELKRIVLKACAYDPKDRYASPEEMRRDLERLSGIAGGSGASVVICAPSTAQPLEDQENKTVGLFARKPDDKRPHQDSEGTVGIFSNRTDTESKNKNENTAPAQDQSAQTAEADPIQERPELQENRKKRKGIWIAFATLPVSGAVMVALFLLNCQKCGGRQTQSIEVVAETTNTPIASSTPKDTLPPESPAGIVIKEPTPEPTPVPTGEPTITPSSTPMPDQTDAPTAKPTAAPPTKPPTAPPTKPPTAPPPTPEPTWSSWSTNTPPSGAYQTDTKTQYRYRDMSTTTSSSSSLSGWSLLRGPETVYGDWSSWSFDSISGSDTLQVERRTVYRLYYKECPNCGAHNAFASMDDKCRDCKKGFNDPGSKTTWTTTPYSQLGASSYSSTKMAVGSGSKNQWFFNKADLNKTSPSDSSYIKYQYRSRSISTLYTFYKWSEWSSWNDSYVESSSTRQVETRVLYRYKK